jgi:hypothetical protein
MPLYDTVFIYDFYVDFVDRGRRGIEILMLLFSLNLLYPQSVFMNRGNHESRMLNAVFGFEKEILTKYSIEAIHDNIATSSSDLPSVLHPKELFNLCQQVFNLLPLGTLINEKILVVRTDAETD